jgi:outer membrane receptor protein involved in Fe transport
MFGGEGLVRLQHSYVGDSLNQLTDSATSPQMGQGDYEITDLIVSMEIDKWQAQLRVSNLTDERGITYEDSSDFDQFWGRNSSTVIRPRSFSFSLRRFF